jgi:hypothetical protein
MTAEILLLVLIGAVALLAAGIGALILSAFGSTGWFVILALGVTVLLAGWLVALHLASRAEWTGDGLTDEWRAGWPRSFS